MLAALYFVGSVLQCLGFSPWLLSALGGLSVIPALFMLMSSFVFGFCPCHRMYIYYCIVADTVNVTDRLTQLPFSDLGMVALHLTLALALIVLITCWHERHLGEAAPACA